MLHLDAHPVLEHRPTIATVSTPPVGPPRHRLAATREYPPDRLTHCRRSAALDGAGDTNSGVPTPTPSFFPPSGAESSGAQSLRYGRMASSSVKGVIARAANGERGEAASEKDKWRGEGREGRRHSGWR